MQNTCLNPEEIEQYVTGTCPADKVRLVKDHLQKCDTCRQAVESSRENEDLLGRLAGVVEPETVTIDSVSEPPATGEAIDSEELPTLLPGQTGSPTVGQQDKGPTILDGAAEEYEILDEIDRGGQAIVYRAVQKATKRTVALKVLEQKLYTSDRAQYRFEREIELAARLRHPNIVTIYDSGITQGQNYFAMEYIQGRPLEKYIQEKNLTLRQTMELFSKISSAVAYAHQRGIMHRDLKPSNILVDDEGEPHILDFGIAKATEEADETSREGVTLAGQIVGTLAFMSPEQASGKLDMVDVRTDVYAIGVILYKLLLNEYPYDISGTTLKILQHIQETDPLRPSKTIKHFNSDIEAILLKTLEKDLDRRYASAVELKQDIDNWLEGNPVLARAGNTLYVLRKLIVKHRYASAVMGLLALIVIGFSVFTAYLAFQLQEKTNEQEQTIQWLEQEVKNNETAARGQIFADVLYLWHTNQLSFAKFLSHKFLVDQKTREYLAIQILLGDTQSVTERVNSLRAQREEIGPCFTEYVIGEIYFREEMREQAIQAYQQCLNLHLVQKHPLDVRIKLWVINRLKELAGKQTIPGTLDGGGTSHAP
jgi:serine/threonine protein kinase